MFSVLTYWVWGTVVWASGAGLGGFWKHWPVWILVLGVTWVLWRGCREWEEESPKCPCFRINVFETREIDVGPSIRSSRYTEGYLCVVEHLAYSLEESFSDLYSIRTPPLTWGLGLKIPLSLHGRRLLWRTQVLPVRFQTERDEGIPEKVLFSPCCPDEATVSQVGRLTQDHTHPLQEPASAAGAFPSALSCERRNLQNS